MSSRYNSFHTMLEQQNASSISQATGQPPLSPNRLPTVEEMLSGKSSVESVSDARHVLLNTLQELLRNRIHNTMWELYNDAVEFDLDVKEGFMENLKSVEHWNSRIISAEVDEIRQQRRDFDELLTGVFVSTFMVLASVMLGQNDAEIRLKVPSVEHFIHEVYICVGQEMYAQPFLYTDPHANTSIQHRQFAMDVIDRCVDRTVQNNLPLKDVMQVDRHRSALLPQSRRPLPPQQQQPYASNLPRNLLTPMDSVSQQDRPHSKKKHGKHHHRHEKPPSNISVSSGEESTTSSESSDESKSEEITESEDESSSSKEEEEEEEAKSMHLKRHSKHRKHKKRSQAPMSVHVKQ